MSERWLYFSDIHVPHHDPESVQWVIEGIEKWKPDHLIFGGDGIDANAASRWPNEYKHSLKDEYDSFNQILQDCRKAAPDNCKLVWIRGNHEDNIVAPNRIKEDVRELCAIENNVAEHEYWKAIPYSRHHIKGAYKLGQVYFIHGHELAPGKLDEQAIKMANYEPFSLTVNGHTHRPTLQPVQVMLRKTPLAHWRIDAGCSMAWDKAIYMNRLNMTDWGHAYVVGEAMPLKSPRKSREWNAEVRVKDMAGDTDVVLWKSNL